MPDRHQQQKHRMLGLSGILQKDEPGVSLWKFPKRKFCIHERQKEMRYQKTESTVVNYAKLLLMLDEGRYNRDQLAEELGISTAKVARYFVVLRVLFHMEIVFYSSPVIDEKTGKRGRGRTGVMGIRSWGILPEQRCLEVCRKLTREFGSRQEANG